MTSNPTTTAHPPGATAPKRLLSAGLEGALEQFASPEMLAAGKVNIIALDAIAERFGARWGTRREQVYQHVEVCLDRHLGNQGFHLRISDTDYLICHPAFGRHLAQASCCRLLRDILRHFLGQQDFPQIDVHEVLSLSADGVEARRIVESEVMSAAEARSFAPPAEREKRPSPFGPLENWTPFVSSTGRTVNAHAHLSSVFEFRGMAAIGLRLRGEAVFAGSNRPCSRPELASFSNADRLRLDLAILVAGLSQLHGKPARMKPQALIVPISLGSLSTSEGRRRILGLLNMAQRYVSHGLICELREVEGAPAVTLQAAVAAIRPFALLVIAHVDGAAGAGAMALRLLNLHGVSIDCPPNLVGKGLEAWACAAVAAAKRAVRSVLLHGLPDLTEAPAVKAAGATHASLVGP